VKLNPINKISSFVDAGACCGCGSCAGICPTNAIIMSYGDNQALIPKFDKNSCTGCGICVNVCPMLSETKSENQQVSMYLGYSNDKERRFSATTAGIATELMVSIIESSSVNGIVNVCMSLEEPLTAEAIWCTTREDIIKCSGSKYQMVSVNELIIKKLKKGKKIAVIGLPCHLKALSLLPDRYQKNIILKIGLFCSHNVSKQATLDLLQKLNINPSDVREMSYRGKGWPGCMTINLKNGHEYNIKNNHSIWSSFFNSGLYTPEVCNICTDTFAEHSDISLGDAWDKSILNKKTSGIEVIITKTKVGEKYLKELEDSGKITLEDPENINIENTQRVTIYHKSYGVASKLKQNPALLDSWGLKEQNLPSPNIFDRILCLYKSIFFSINSKKTKKIYTKLPKFIIKYHRMFFQIMERIAISLHTKK